MTPSLSHDLELAHHLADAAGSVSVSRFRRELRKWSKDDGSLVTEADLAVEDEIRERLAIERPDDAVLGEERGETGVGPRRWIVDGIDGTVGFAAGSSDWWTLIALERDGCVIVSVCDQPSYKRRYWASRGGGAFYSDEQMKEPQPLRVNANCELKTARSFVQTVQDLHGDQFLRITSILAGASRPEPPSIHPALEVATGGYDFAVLLKARPWDLAGPSLVVEEAGGRFTDLAGQPRLTSGTAIFSNGLLHQEIIALVSTVNG